MYLLPTSHTDVTKQSRKKRLRLPVKKMTKVYSKKWRKIATQDKEVFQQMAALDKKRLKKVVFCKLNIKVKSISIVQTILACFSHEQEGANPLSVYQCRGGCREG